MTKKMPPIPPEQISDKGPGSGGGGSSERAPHDRSPPSNLAEQDRQGNIKQNTTHQGYQQDR